MKLGNKIYKIDLGTKFNFGFNLDKLYESLKPVSALYPSKGFIKTNLKSAHSAGALEMYRLVSDSMRSHVMVFNALVLFGSSLKWATIVTPTKTVCNYPILEPHLIGLYYLARPYMLAASSIGRALVMDSTYNCPAYVRHEHRILVHKPDSDDPTEFVRLDKLDPEDYNG